MIADLELALRRKDAREGERGEERERGDWEREREREGRERRRERDTKPKNAFITTKNEPKISWIIKLISWIICQKHPTPSSEFLGDGGRERERQREVEGARGYPACAAGNLG